MSTVTVYAMPPQLMEASRLDEVLRDWIATLSDSVAAAVLRWSLVVGEPFQPGGQTAWVAPARSKADAQLVLKVGHRHVEGAGESEGLRLWDGHGAVRLIDTYQDDDTVVMLMERCIPGTPLSQRTEPEQDVVLTGLLRRLWVEPPVAHSFRSLQTMCDEWAAGCEKSFALDPPGLYLAGLDLDPGLVRLGLTLFRELPGTADRCVVMATDLHAGNVLAAAREPWLVIDPKPHVGDPANDSLQHMLNCPERLHAEPEALCDRMADLLGLDRQRVRLWLFARCVQESPRWPGLTDVVRRLAPA